MSYWSHALDYKIYQILGSIILRLYWINKNKKKYLLPQVVNKYSKFGHTLNLSDSYISVNISSLADPQNVVVSNFISILPT